MRACVCIGVCGGGSEVDGVVGWCRRGLTPARADVGARACTHVQGSVRSIWLDM